MDLLSPKPKMSEPQIPQLPKPPKPKSLKHPARQRHPQARGSFGSTCARCGPGGTEAARPGEERFRAAGFVGGYVGFWVVESFLLQVFGCVETAKVDDGCSF